MLGLELGLGLGLGDIESFIITDTICSAHVAENDLTTHGPSYIHTSPATSCDIATSFLTYTVCSSHMVEDGVTAVCIKIQ